MLRLFFDVPLIIKGFDFCYLIKTPALNKQNYSKSKNKTFFLIIAGRSGGKQVKDSSSAPLEYYDPKVDEHIYHADYAGIFIKRRKCTHRVASKNITSTVEETYRKSRRAKDCGGSDSKTRGGHPQKPTQLIQHTAPQKGAFFTVCRTPFKEESSYRRTCDKTDAY